MYVREGFAPHITIHGVTAKARFPDILKLPRERLELLQLGWRASDEGEMAAGPSWALHSLGRCSPGRH